MVKGISRQVIVVHAPDPKLFEQAIFILKEDAIREGITDEVLLKEAEAVVRNATPRRQAALYAGLWACGGAMLTGIAWFLTVIL